MKDENVITIVGKVESSEVKGRNGNLTAFKIISNLSKYDQQSRKYNDLPQEFNCIIFEALPLKAGDKVRISGHLGDNVFNAKDGKVYHNAQIVADMVKVYKPYNSGSQAPQGNNGPDNFPSDIPY